MGVTVSSCVEWGKQRGPTDARVREGRAVSAWRAGARSGCGTPP